jgi:hypothetical protein
MPATTGNEPEERKSAASKKSTENVPDMGNKPRDKCRGLSFSSASTGGGIEPGAWE